MGVDILEEKGLWLPKIRGCGSIAVMVWLSIEDSKLFYKNGIKEMWWLISCVNLMGFRDAQRASKVSEAVECLRKSWAFITDWEPKMVLSKAGWHHLIVEAPTRTKRPRKESPLLTETPIFFCPQDIDAVCSQAFWLGLGLKPALFSELQMGLNYNIGFPDSPGQVRGYLTLHYCVSQFPQ